VVEVDGEEEVCQKEGIDSMMLLYLLYFRGKLLKSFPLSGTDILLQSDLVLSSKFVLNLELGFEELVEPKVEGV
jgi:hypothetical protein